MAFIKINRYPKYLGKAIRNRQSLLCENDRCIRLEHPLAGQRQDCLQAH
jgi:hypothetical protein